MAVHVPVQELRIVNADDETVLDLTPIQGTWSETQYLTMTDHSRRLLEYTDGVIEVLPMPTDRHQVILRYLLFAFFTFTDPHGGIVLCAPLRLQIRPGKFREPDLLVLRDAHDPRRQNAYWLGADLVVEIVSPDSPERDTRDKRADYAEAHIPEYWIVNPDDETIAVLRLEGDRYVEHGVFRPGEHATSALLPGLAVAVSAVFEQPRP